MSPATEEFDPSGRAANFAGYSSDPLPGARDAAIDELVGPLVERGASVVGPLLTRVSDEARDVLVVYAERMAELAVVESSERRLLYGFVGAFLSGLDKGRASSLAVLDRLGDSADRIGVDLGHMCTRVAELVAHPGAAYLASWLGRRLEGSSAPGVEGSGRPVRFVPDDPAQEAFDGYLKAPMPSRLDDAVEAFVDRVVDGGSGAVSEALGRLSERARGVLLVYAERTASLAVREGGGQRLVHGLVAVVLGGLDQDRRESLMVLATLEDAAGRVGVDVDALFGRAAEVVGDAGDARLRSWRQRPVADRSLQSMGYVAGDDAGGFRYEWVAGSRS